MSKTKCPPLQTESFVMNDNGTYVNLDSLPHNEQAEAMREVQENVMRASAEYHGYNVRFEGDTAILTVQVQINL